MDYSTTHSFNTDLAAITSINAAIIYKNLLHWCRHNKANNCNEFEGKYWTYNSTIAFQKLFYYMGGKEIRNALELLEMGGYVITGNFNKNKFDKTKWYSVAEYIDSPKGLIDSPIGQIDPSKGLIDIAERADLTDINTDINTNIKRSDIKRIASEKSDADQAQCREIWGYYKNAYFDRYNTEPVRNAKVNKNVRDLLARLGQEAKHVAAYYVGINDAYLIKRSHDFGSLLAGAESYRTQWATGRQVTTASALATDRTQTNLSVIQQAQARLLAKGEENHE